MSTPADDAGDVAALRVGKQRQALVDWFHDTTMGCAHRGDAHECVIRARNFIESGWLKTHDADREEFIAGVRAALSHTEAERDEARAEADRLRDEVERLTEQRGQAWEREGNAVAEANDLRVTLGKVAAVVRDPKSIQTIGALEAVHAVRNVIAADPVSLADVRDDSASHEVDDTLCAEHRDGKPGQPHEWRRGRRKTRLVICHPANPEVES